MCSRVVGAHLAVFALSPAPQDAELVPLGIGQNEPAAAIVVAEVMQWDCPKCYDAVDLVIARTVGRFKVKVNAVLHLLALRYLNEQQLRLMARPDDHALLVPRLVRIAGHVPIAQHLLPERGKDERVAAIKRRMRDPRSHPADGIDPALAAWSSASDRGGAAPALADRAKEPRAAFTALSACQDTPTREGHRVISVFYGQLTVNAELVAVPASVLSGPRNEALRVAEPAFSVLMMTFSLPLRCVFFSESKL